ncbi:MAG: 16S rRNA (uracil(1498)-N(3))-methyltransferase [Pyrinomonadaceae bacterium]
MTRRRFYASPENFARDALSATLDADETRHLREVLRLRPGDEVYLFNGEGLEFLCEVETIERRGPAVLKIKGEVRAARPESALQLTLALALLKGEKFDLVVQKATELGVARIVPLITARADVRPREERDAAKRQTRWQRLALEAAKQSGRARLPEIALPVTFSEIIAGGEAAHDDVRVFFSERDGAGLRAWAAAARSENVRSIAAMVGPEGGWEDEEIRHARDAAWSIVTLGGRTLRAETAAITVVALLQHLFGDLH